MVDKNELFSSLAKKISEVLKSKADRDEKLETVCNLLRDNVSYYNWVGFYIVDKKRQKELVLGPFKGEPTEHVRIPFGRGICGQAA
jgi:L-methionine (R)-S-oxide reductase